MGLMFPDLSRSTEVNQLHNLLKRRPITLLSMRKGKGMVLTEDRHLVALPDHRGEQISLVLPLVLHIAIYPIDDGEAHENTRRSYSSSSISRRACAP